MNHEIISRYIRQPARLPADLRDRITRGTTADFPTRVEVAARHSDLMFACYASALGNQRVPLPAAVDDWVVDQLEVLGTLDGAGVGF